jgi:hypothetical protein
MAGRAGGFIEIDGAEFDELFSAAFAWFAAVFGVGGVFGFGE